MLERGSVVISLKGRDKGYMLAVLSSEGRRALVADGGERPVDRPKQKNIRHLEATGFILKDEEMRSSKALRRALRRVQNEINGNF